MRSLLVALLLLALPATAQAVCNPAWRAKLEGPSPVGFFAARFGSPVAACAANELELAGAARAIVEPDDFYGNIRAAALLAANVTFLERGAVFGAFELVRYQTVISSVDATAIETGDLSLGASWRFAERETFVATGYVRALLPTGRGVYVNARPFGGEVGLAAQSRLSASWVASGNLAGLSTASVSEGPSDPRFGIAAVLGATFRPTHGFGVLFELDTQLGYAATLDHLAAGVGVRIHEDRRGLELFVKVPLAGRERSLVTAGLRLRYDFDVALDRRLR